MPNPLSLSDFLQDRIPCRTQLKTSVLPHLLRAIAQVGKCLREELSVEVAGSTNTSGDNQLNIDLKTNAIVHDAVRKCASIVAVSSEEDEGENPVVHDDGVKVREDGKGAETYAVAFDPLDGSSIIPANWSVGTIIGIWDGPSALNVCPRTHEVAAILGVLGPRTTAVVAIRVPGAEPLCFEVGLRDTDPESGTEIDVLREKVEFTPMENVKTRYFAPANLRAASSLPAYGSLINTFITERYTLRYSGGLVPDIYHSLIKGHGVYISPATEGNGAKLRRLYELCPVALVVECAGGAAVDAGNGRDVLEGGAGGVDERGSVVCGTVAEVGRVVGVLREG